MEMLLELFRDEEGADAAEYGLLAALIAVVIIAGATLLGTSINAVFGYIGDKIGATMK